MPDPADTQRAARALSKARELNLVDDTGWLPHDEEAAVDLMADVREALSAALRPFEGCWSWDVDVRIDDVLALESAARAALADPLLGRVEPEVPTQIRAEQIEQGDRVWIEDEGEWYAATRVVVRESDVLLWLDAEDEPWDALRRDQVMWRLSRVERGPDDNARCECGHTAHWHAAYVKDRDALVPVPQGAGVCDGSDCDCKRFVEQKRPETYECRDNHGDERTRIPHTHVRRVEQRGGDDG